LADILKDKAKVVIQVARDHMVICKNCLYM